MITLNTAAHIIIALIVAVHYAVKQGDKSSVKSLLDSLTPEQQLQFLSTKDKRDESGKTSVQWAPAGERKEIDRMLRQYMREADFEVNYGEFFFYSHSFQDLESGNGISFLSYRYYSIGQCLFSTTTHGLSFDRQSFQTFC